MADQIIRCYFNESKINKAVNLKPINQRNKILNMREKNVFLKRGF